MATITTILASDIIASSRVTLNTNFANLNTDKVDINSTYADPAWITSLAGSKITGNIGGNAATATALATARTIAGVSFDGTANIAIPSTGLSDSSDIVRGASSVASGQVLYGTAAGVAGSEANLFWDAANDRLGVGTNTPADLAQFQSASGAQARLTIVAGATAQSPGLQLGWPGNTNAGIIRVDLAGANGGDLSIWSKATGSSVSEKVRVFGSGNVAIGTTTDDGANRLQVAGSVAVGGAVANNSITITRTGANPSSLQVGAFSDKPTIIFNGTNGLAFETFTTTLMNLSTAGTLTLRNETATTGVTQFIVRAGAGQSTTNLLTVQNSAGTALAGITGAGSFFTGNNANATGDSLIDANGLRFGSTVLVRWSNNLPVNAADISLSRASANTLQVGDGGSNANGGLFASSIGVGVTPSIAANVNQVIIRAGSAQSTTNLTTWQNSSGTAQSRVNVNGGVESAVFLAVASSTSFTGYRLVLGTAQLEIGSAVGLNFSSSTEATATKDAGLARNAAGVVEINSGTAGTFRDLYLRGVRPVGSTVANLPTASGNTGMMATVTDATVTTIGTTVAGGGGNTVLVWSNGTNWRIYAN
jgi:hypothetical protein